MGVPAAVDQARVGAGEMSRGDFILRSAGAVAAVSGPSRSTVNRQLRDTEKAMALAKGRVDRLTTQLTGETDHAQLSVVGAELTAAQSELDSLESRWLELAELHDV